MATAPKAKPQAPKLGEIAPPESPLSPLRLRSEKSLPYADMLQPEDSVLKAKGGIENLRIYEELLRDDQVASTWQQRRLALTSCNLVVEPGAEDAASKAAATALQAELDALAWDDVTDKMLYSVFYGWGVAEVIWRPNGGMVSFDRIVVRDRARFRFDRTGGVWLWTNGSGWVLMPERKFWTVRSGGDHHDDPYGLGLAHSLYWPVFFKRNTVQFWLVFLEKFGMPTAMAKLPPGATNDPQQMQKALEMLQQISTDAGVVVPDNVVVELLEASRGASADYSGMHDAMNKAISKIVVGQTMTTENGSSRAQAQVHADVAEAIVEADSDLLCGSFNGGPVRWWCDWNFPGAVPPRVYRHTEPAEDLNARAERDTKIAGLGYSPTPDYILETYGEGWEKKPDPVQAVAGALMPNPDDPAAADQASFAEGEPFALSALRAAARSDQAAIYDAARLFAERYRTVTGMRVQQLLQAAEFSEDPETFVRRLNEILAEAPAPDMLQRLSRAVGASRMLGALRGQRAPK